MIGILITSIAKRLIAGRSSMTQSRAEFLSKVILGAGAAVLVIAAAALWLKLHDRAVRQDVRDQVEAQAAPAREEAAEERVADTIRNMTNEQEMHDAIEAAPTGGTLSPAAHALACQRLRRVGRIPTACGSPSGDGAQAGTD